MKISTLHDLYIEELRDIYDAENQIIKVLPQLAKAATDEELRTAFEEHLEQTREQVSRLEKIFESEGVSPKGKKCQGITGIIEEAKEIIDADIEPEILDAALIGAAQRVEHYEIAAYGCVCTYAKILGNEEDADMLQQTLDEEKETDENLTDLAESSINVEAAESEEGEEEQEQKPKKSPMRK